MYSPWPEGSWERVDFQLSPGNSFPAPSPVVRQGGTTPGNLWELIPWEFRGWLRDLGGAGNSMPHGQSGEPMFLHDIRCVFPSGISSRKSLAKFAFQEMLVSLCFCQRSQRVGAALEFHSRSSESLSSERGRGGSQVLLPWFYSSMETGAVWHLDPATSHLPAAPAPMELGT